MIPTILGLTRTQSSSSQTAVIVAQAKAASRQDHTDEAAMTAGLCVLRIKEMIRVVRADCATSEPIRNLSDQHEHTMDANTASARWE